MTNIVQSLNEGKVTFTYKKSDGTSRKAIGTTNSSFIPESSRAPNKNTETSQTVTYYDLERNAWRSFTKSSLDMNSIKVEAPTV